MPVVVVTVVWKSFLLKLHGVVQRLKTHHGVGSILTSAPLCPPQLAVNTSLVNICVAYV